VIGHRGTGKTSLVEALLYESGTVNRLGSVADQSTVSDHDEDERKRGMSISASVTHLEWEGRLINLIDTPGEPSFQADVLSALRVVEGAIMTVSGVLGVEVGTERLWRRCDELGTSRLVLVNLLDRERADFFAALEQLRERLSDKCVAVEIPIGTEQDFRGVVDLVHMVAYLHGEDASGHDESVPIPDDLKPLADEYHDKLMDVVAETSDELMERYLDGGEITREEMAVALKQLVTDGQVFPVGCGAATRNIGSHGLLDLIVEGLPSPARARNVPETGGASTLAYIFKTIADPYSGRINLMRVYAGTLKGELLRGDVERVILDGFFPIVDAAAPPRARGGLTAFGLPYESDPAITRHVVAFLRRHLPDGAAPADWCVDGFLRLLQQWAAGTTVRFFDVQASSSQVFHDLVYRDVLIQAGDRLLLLHFGWSD
jgi:elongation factor G